MPRIKFHRPEKKTKKPKPKRERKSPKKETEDYTPENPSKSVKRLCILLLVSHSSTES